jgi:hypothetical protein
MFNSDNAIKQVLWEITPCLACVGQQTEKEPSHEKDITHFVFYLDSFGHHPPQLPPGHRARRDWHITNTLSLRAAAHRPSDPVLDLKQGHFGMPK